MATDLGKAYVQIIPSAQGIKGSITKLLGGEAGSAGVKSGENFGNNLVGKIKTIVAAAGIGKLLSDAISAGADLQQSIGGIETLFGTGGQSIEEYAKSVGKSVSEITDEYDILKKAESDMLANASEAYKTAGLSANDYMQQVTSFAASLKQSIGSDITVENMKSLTEVANQAVIDMADNANKMGTDISSIQSAYQGFAKQNYTMLDNLKLGYGGTKTEMERLLKDAEKISGVKYDIKNLDDVYNAIHVIQQDLGITGTTAKEASSTISGSLASVKSAFKNVLANLTLGQDIGPAMEGLVQTATNFLINNLIPAVVNIVKTLPNAIHAAIETGYPILSSYVDEMISNVSTWIHDNFPLILQKGMDIVVKLSEGIRNNLPEILQKGIEIVQNIIQGILDSIPSIVTTIVQLVASLIQALIDNFPLILQKGIEIVMQIQAGIIKAVPDFFKSVFNAFKSIDWGSIGSNIINGIINGIKNGLSSIVNAAKEVASSAFNAAKRALGISSPSKAFMYIGEMSDAGLAKGLENNAKLVKNAMNDITGSMLSSVNPDFKLYGVNKGIGANSPISGGYNQNIVINSPTPLTPSEIARQTRNSTKQLVLAMNLGV